MVRFQLLSLRWRLLLLVSLSVAPLAALTIAVGFRESAHALNAAQENLQRLANLAAANEAQSIEQTMQILRDLSSVRALFEGNAKCDELLADMLTKNTDYVNFGVIELNGDVNCSAVKSPAKVNLADRDHFKRAVSERRFVAGNYVFGRVVQKHTANLTYPVIKNEAVQAVLFASLDLAELDKFVTDIKLAPDSILWTVDGKGSVISRRPDPEGWFGKKFPGATELIRASQEGPNVRVDSDGIRRLYASANVGPPTLTNYTVIVGVPEEGILAQARRDQRFAMLGLIITVLAAGFAAWWGGEILIVRRVRRLATTANSIASGSLSTRTGVRYGKEEISELAKALDTMAISLEAKEIARNTAESLLVAANHRKDEFLAMLAHELRNPLAPISAGAQILLHTQKANAQVMSTANVISRQVAHMSGLVDDLLDVSRVTRGLVKLDVSSIDFRTIVDDALEQAGPLLKQKRHTLTVDIPHVYCCVMGDHKRLVQVTVNLLNNATKYTPEGGRVHVAIVLNSENVILRVSDSGIGMAAELVPHVFELFSQAERTSDRTQGGLGIGLALANTLVQLHGGTLQAESDGLGRGSTFCVSIPRCHDVVETATATVKQTSLTTKRNCLVVDDNIDAAQTLAIYLEATGNCVRIAYTAVQALSISQEFHPDICLLDIGLPDHSGIELVNMLRSKLGFKSALMIAMTGYGRKHDREIALAAGFDHYFVKPLDTAKLRVIIESPDS